MCGHQGVEPIEHNLGTPPIELQLGQILLGVQAPRVQSGRETRIPGWVRLSNARGPCHNSNTAA